ncbi:MAG TPA: glycosyltransferase family 4 protein [Gemmataceae bacterium]|nr:glycosyltransferase family 4 protein [Gemmataceae bacterium]
MRICLYTDTALPKMGGQEMVVDALARQYQALGHDVAVLAPSPRKLSVNDAAYPYPVARHPRFYSTQYFIDWYRRYLLNHFRQRPFDLLHCHGIYPPTYLASLLRDEIRVPMVVTSHGGDVYECNVRLQKSTIVERCVQGLRSAAALIAISRFTRDGFARLCPEIAPRIVEIPNGVHLANYTERVARPSTCPLDVAPKSYAVFLGRLKYRKGVDVLLQALARTPESDRIQLVIIGDGEERAALEVLAGQLDLTERVRFLGTVTGPAKTYLLQNARFGVIPSRQWEAFGLVVLEGYASGLPMLATDMPGLADLVRPEKTGLLVPPQAPDALAAALHRLLTDDVLINRMSGNARHAVSEYDWRNIALRHIALYDSLLARRQRLAA